MPIINSLLDIDFYKLTMGQFVWSNEKYRDVNVKYAFTNRTKGIKLGNILTMDEICKELDHVRTLSLTDEEVIYLNRLGKESDCTEQPSVFLPQYTQFLKKVELPNYKIRFTKDGNIGLTFEGPWATAIYWETIALSIINELYCKAIGKGVENLSEGLKKLDAKIDKLRPYEPRRIAAPPFTIADFGTRRRYCKAWHDIVFERILLRLPSLMVGTSNVSLAMRTGQKPIGTMAHELFMVNAALNNQTDEALRASQFGLLSDWEAAYGRDLCIALTDTFGTNAFFEDFGPVTKNWKGIRHDSGNPYKFAEKVVSFYKESAPYTNPVVVFSDGLDVGTIVDLYETFKGQLRMSFGWGTNLTNDVGIRPLSLVIKAVEADGKPCVKLSDNPAKTMGPAEEVERYKGVFGHTGGKYEKCTY